MSEPTVTSTLLTAEQLAIALGNSNKAAGDVMLRWMREGRIPAAIREGKFVRFDLAAVKAALAKRATKGGLRK